MVSAVGRRVHLREHLMKATGIVMFATLTVRLVAQFPGGIPGVLAPNTAPELVQEGFVFTEGPVGTKDGGLLFCDIRSANRIYRLDATGKISVARERSNGASGLALARNGDLLAAEGDGKRISRSDATGRVMAVTEGSGSGPFLAPNDLIVDSKDGIYFTDPGPRPVVPGRKVHVYYLPAGAKQPLVIDDQIARPNGLTLTTDERTLVVDDTIGEIVYAFDVQSGTVTNRRPFTRLHDIPAGQDSGADGMALDRNDRIYVTTVTGIQVFDKTGHYLGTIKVPRQPANLAFAGPAKHFLYITAREGLYRVPMLARGPERLGK